MVSGQQNMWGMHKGDRDKNTNIKRDREGLKRRGHWPQPDDLRRIRMERDTEREGTVGQSNQRYDSQLKTIINF